MPCTGVSAMIGTHGRSRAARKPVDPELVQLTMAAALSVCTTWRADGSSFPVEYWSHPLFRHGQPIGSVVTFLDISQRRAFELTIRESEQKFRAVFEGAELGIAVADLKSGEITVNPAYGRMLGCTTKEMSSLGIFDELTHPDDAERQSNCDRSGHRRGKRGQPRRYPYPEQRGHLVCPAAVGSVNGADSHSGIAHRAPCTYG